MPQGSSVKVFSGRTDWDGNIPQDVRCLLSATQIRKSEAKLTLCLLALVPDWRVHLLCCCHDCCHCHLHWRLNQLLWPFIMDRSLAILQESSRPLAPGENGWGVQSHELSIYQVFILSSMKTDIVDFPGLYPGSQSNTAPLLKYSLCGFCSSGEP